MGENYSDDEIGDKKHVELEDDISAGEEKCSCVKTVVLCAINTYQ